MQHLKILCVDDNPELRENLVQQFGAEDFEVDVAENGIVALEMLKKKIYDLVLLDLVMPGMDGITTLKEMKKNSVFPNVIMLTGVADVATALECVKLGAKDYISKPYDPEELLHTVIKVLGS
jgi:DNA-binding response OmpR family regulator